MGLVNAWIFTKTSFDWQRFNQGTHGKYRAVSVRDYHNKDGKLPDGLVVTLSVIADDNDYGVDKHTGEPRENNFMQNFEVTVLSDKVRPRKGDIVQLIEYDEDNSFVINFNIVLRFRGIRVIESQGAKQ